MTRLLLPAKSAFLILAGYVAWQGFVFIRPEPREYTKPEKIAIRNACDQAAELLNEIDQSDKTRRVGVAHFINDPNDEFTAAMKETLKKNSKWKIEDQSIIQKFLGDVTAAVRNATSLDEIVNAGRRVNLDSVVAGKIIEVKEEDDTVSVEAVIHVYDLENGKTLLNKTIVEKWEPPTSYRIRHAVDSLHPIIRFCLWLIFVGLLPLLTAQLTHWIVEKSSNVASFIMLSAYTLLDLIALIILFNFSEPGAGVIAILFLSVACCAGYNFWISERIADNN